MQIPHHSYFLFPQYKYQQLLNLFGVGETPKFSLQAFQGKELTFLFVKKSEVLKSSSIQWVRRQAIADQ